jgi:hypothetical protein
VVEREGTLGHVIALEQIEERFAKNYEKGIIL